MKKIPTLFVRNFNEPNKLVTPEVTPGMEWVLAGEGEATLKMDGSCCAIINGELYKRYDCKAGRKPPEGAIPCCDPDPITGHWPHWVKVDENKPEDKWFIVAFKNYEKLPGHIIIDHTYEAIGPHFNGNPYGLEEDTVYPHGFIKLPLFPRDFEDMRDYLELYEIEGVVFWKDGEPKCKIKRSDFGFAWNKKGD